MYNTIVSAIKEHSKSNPEKICLYDAKASITYGEYFKKICGIAHFLVNNGINKGDIVVIKSAQTIEFLACLHAVQAIGAIVVPLEKNVKAERMDGIIALTEAKAVISNAECEGVTTFLYNQLCELSEDNEPVSLPHCEEESTILFTTGTTGKSKGILMNHYADVAVAENVKYGVSMKENNVEVIPMPLNHSFGLRRYYGNMINGSTCVLLDGVIFISKFFDAFDKLGATAAAMAPSALSIIFKLSGDKLAEYKDKIDYFEFGGAHMPEPEKEKLLSLLPNSRLYNFYGSTEAGCACILDFNSSENMPYCIGRPTINSGIDFVDESGKIVKTTAENPAKMVTNGKMLMMSYYKEPELTAETLIDGYIYSNDLGYKDESGRVFMLGRIDDVIISGGNKIAPNDVEDVCLSYEGVSECAVIGVEDKLMGQVPKLFVVINDKYDENKMMQFLASRLESFQVPKIVQIIEAIPKTFNGKPLKRELQKM